MKTKICVILVLLCSIVTLSLAENVVQEEITIVLPDVTRNGIYTGSINENGEPDGYGVFEAVNSEGVAWHYVGQWKNGKMTGFGREVWDDGQMEIGTFENSVLIDSQYDNISYYESLSTDALHTIVNRARNELFMRELLPSNRDIVLVDTSDVLVYLTGQYGYTSYTNGWLGIEFEAVTVNNSKLSVSLTAENCSVNGWEVYCTTMQGVNPGKKRKGTITVMISDAGISTFDEIEDLEWDFCIRNSDTYDRIADVYGVVFQNQVAAATYLDAVSLMESKQYQAAADAFRSISGFRDSDQLANEATYLRTKELIESKEYNRALRLLKTIDNYKDSAELITQVELALKNAVSVDKVRHAKYGFSMNEDGWYESENTGDPDSCAVCKIRFTTDNGKITLKIINDGEYGKDYGLVSNLDLTLSYYNTPDENAYKSYENEIETGIDTISFDVPDTREHFIYVKYIKDSSGDSGSDSLKFKVE